MLTHMSFLPIEPFENPHSRVFPFISGCLFPLSEWLCLLEYRSIVSNWRLSDSHIAAVVGGHTQFHEEGEVRHQQVIHWWAMPG